MTRYLWEFPDNPNFKRDLTRSMAAILCATMAAPWVLILILKIPGTEAAHALNEFYKSELMGFILSNQLPLGVVLLLAGVAGCVWMAKRK